MIDVGKVAIVRFPGDAGGSVIAVALVKAYRGGMAWVAKTRGRNGGRPHWCKSRWVPADDIAREATKREQVMGMAIDPLPPRVAA